MPKLSVADGTGTYKTAGGLWVADSSGTYKPAVGAWAADSSGTYQRAWPYGPSIQAVSAVQGSPAWSRLTVSVVANSAVLYELYLPGVFTDPIYRGNVPSFSFAGAPSNTYRFRWRVYGSDGSFADSQVFTGKIAALPAPSNFRLVAHSSSMLEWQWDPVAGVDGYEIDNMAIFGAPSVGSVPATQLTFTETGLAANTNFSRAVRSRIGFAFSTWSTTQNKKTDAAPGPAAGRYLFPATSAHAWAPGYGHWRPSSDGVIHGNGDNWGGSNGNQITLFTYNLTNLHTLHGGRVTRFQVEIHRDSVAGYSAPQLSHWALGTDVVLPAGPPNLGAQTDAGSLAWGQAAIIDLPVSWGQALIDGAFGAASLNWGGVAGRYMRGPLIAAQGQLYITIG